MNGFENLEFFVSCKQKEYFNGSPATKDEIDDLFSRNREVYFYRQPLVIEYPKFQANLKHKRLTHKKSF